eukprot:c3890_g1_i1.p1 GENE.c3890_g1_i1~~c3890_g1_i1.p1  ORF type:complete len:141 (+),score=26.21 c3890_g1_i1:51-425(+)
MRALNILCFFLVISLSTQLAPKEPDVTPTQARQSGLLIPEVTARQQEVAKVMANLIGKCSIIAGILLQQTTPLWFASVKTLAISRLGLFILLTCVAVALFLILQMMSLVLANKGLTLSMWETGY